MHDGFSVRIAVRSYEVDVNGHVNHAIYHSYGEHARTEHFSAAGCTMSRLVEHGMGIVMLETHCRFLRELRYGDEIEVESRVSFGTGKTFEIAHPVRRVSGDEEVMAAEITCRMGLLDASARRLLPDPRIRLLELATAPALLGA
jgi:acyl-CoA thioester hydrolase